MAAQHSGDRGELCSTHECARAVICSSQAAPSEMETAAAAVKTKMTAAGFGALMAAVREKARGTTLGAERMLLEAAVPG